MAEDDEVISGRVELTGVPETLGQLKAVKQAVSELNNTNAGTEIKIDVVKAAADIKKIETQLQAVQAEIVRTAQVAQREAGVVGRAFHAMQTAPGSTYGGTRSDWVPVSQASRAPLGPRSYTPVSGPSSNYRPESVDVSGVMMSASERDKLAKEARQANEDLRKLSALRASADVESFRNRMAALTGMSAQDLAAPPPPPPKPAPKPAPPSPAVTGPSSSVANKLSGVDSAANEAKVAAAAEKEAAADAAKAVAAAETEKKKAKKQTLTEGQADAKALADYEKQQAKSSADEARLLRQAEAAATKQARTEAAAQARNDRLMSQAQVRADRQAARQAILDANAAEAAARQAGGGGSRNIAPGRSAAFGGGPPSGALNLDIDASNANDAIARMHSLQGLTDKLKANGQRINLNIEASGGVKTEDELSRIAEAARKLTTYGRVAIKVETTGVAETDAQLAELNAAAARFKGQNIAFNIDTTGAKEAADTAKAEAAARRDAAAAAKVQQAEVNALLKTEREEAAAAAEADKQRMSPFRQTANTQSRSILGVPAALAAPAALGLGAFGVGFAAAGYQSLLTTTANQTNLSTPEIPLLDQAVRNAPTASANLKDVAMAYKNITDLQYSATDATQMLDKEVKAATATGSDQAAVILAITSAMKDYNAVAADTAKFTNTTLEAARLANTTFEQWSTTTRTATAIAAAYGVPLKEVDAALVALTQHGFNTARANTQVTGLIQNIAAPTPAAQRALKQLTTSSGIDLVGDFSQQGLAAKGLQGVLDDLGKAVNGDEAKIRQLIPSLRGGQAALVLTTTATQDFNHALDLLGQTADGSLRPVDDAFARIENTVGYKFGTTVKQLKLDAIDVGKAVLPIADALLSAFGVVPPGMIQTGMEFGLLLAAAKTLAIGLDFVEASALKIAATMGADTAALGVNTAAVAQNTGAWTANAAARVSASTLSALQTAQLDTELLAPTVMAGGAAAKQQIAMDAKVVVRQVETTGIATKVTTAIAGVAATLGEVAFPVVLGLAAGVEAGHLYDQLLSKLIAGPRAARNTDVTGANAFLQDVQNNPNLKDAVATAKNAQDTIDQEIASYQKNKAANTGLFLHNTPFGPLANMLGLNADTQIDPIIQMLTDRKRAIQAAVDDRTRGLDPTARAALEPKEAAQPTEGEIQDAVNHYNEVRERAAQLIAEGAPERLVNLALKPEDFEGGTVSDKELKQAKDDLTAWEKQYAAVQTAAKNAENSLGQANLSRGITGLGSQADALHDAAEQLAKVGENNTALNALASMADQFKELTNQETAAADAYNGYLLTLDGTDARIQKMEQLKTRIEAAVKAAEAAKERGTATPEQLALLQNAPNELGNLQRNIDQLSAAEVPDINGLMNTMPNQSVADQIERKLIGDLGGGKQVVIDVRSNVDKVQQELHTLETTPYHANVDITYRVQGAIPPGVSGPQSALNVPIILPNLTQGESSGASPQGNANSGSSLGYRPLDPASYTAIVRSGARGGSSPFEDPQIMAAVMKAAQDQNLDPRALLTFTRFESNNATNISPEMNMANNFGGIKYDGQAGATDSGIRADNGGTYAKYASPQDYFEAMAKNMTTGVYADAYKAGDIGAIRRTYVVGGQGPATPEQEANIQNTIDAYNSYRLKYPAIYGGSSSGYGSAAGAGYAPEIPGANETGGSAEQAIYQRAQAHLGQTKTVVDGLTTDVFGWCDKIVNDIQQEATGVNTRYRSADAQVRAAMAGDPSAGKVISAAEAVPGDLIGWLGTSKYAGSASGHIGVYSGQGNYIGTTDKGVMERPIGTGQGEAVYIRPPGEASTLNPDIGPGTQPGWGGNKAYAHGTAGSSVSPDRPYYDLNAPGGAAYNVTPMYNATGQSRILASLYAQLDETSLSHVTGDTDKFSNYAKQFYEQQNPTNKGAADRQAQEATLNFAIAYAQAMKDVRTNVSALPADYEKIRQVAGPLADITIATVQNQHRIQQAQDINLQAQEKIKSIQDNAASRAIVRSEQDAQVQDVLRRNQRTNEDDDIKRQAQLRTRDRGIEDERRRTDLDFQRQQDKITADRNKLNDNFVPTQRSFEDRARNLQFNQQVGQTDLQNRMTNLQRDQQNIAYQRTSQEQVVESAVRWSPDNNTAGSYAGQLALMHEADLRRRDADKKAIDDLQVLQQQQTKKDALESYNLETERLKAQRTHEDELLAIDLRARKLQITQQDEANRRSKQDLDNRRADEDAATRIAALRLQQKRAEEDAATALANRRRAEDEADALNMKALQDTINANNDLIKGWQTYQSYLDGVQSMFYNIATYAGSSADSIAKMIGAGPGGNPTPLPATVPVPARWRGGKIPSSERLTLVGDDQGRPTSTSEIISAPGATVTPLTDLLHAITNNQPTTVHMPINVNLNMDDWESRLRSEFETAIRNLKAQLKNPNARAARSRGVA